MSEKPKAYKVILLDMDGVLCTAKAHAALATNSMWRHLDPLATRLVQKLANETRAKIVLSSTWRCHFDQSAMTVILENGGFSNVDWHQNWKTPEAPRGQFWTRGEEIEAWLKVHRPDKYVILDDDSDILPDQKPFHIQTNEFDGLGFMDYQNALKILK